MRAWFSIELASGLVLHGLRLMTGEKGPWIAMPAVRQLDQEGQPRLDANGDVRWNQVMEFSINFLAQIRKINSGASTIS